MHPRFPALVGRKTTDGGGGGTVDPGLSPRPGLCLHACQPSDKHAERVIRWTQVLIPDPSAHPDVSVFGESISLYRAGLKLALFLPLGVAMPPSVLTAPSGFTDVSSVFIRPLRADATLDRTPVRKPYISASTYVAVSLILTRRYPSSREDATPADGDS
jgi:hypothetical protein